MLELGGGADPLQRGVVQVVDRQEPIAACAARPGTRNSRRPRNWSAAGGSTPVIPPRPAPQPTTPVPPRAKHDEHVPATRRTTPAAFLGHGNPMNALAHNRYTDSWHAFGQAVGRPRAILVVSAHWFTNVTAVTAMTSPRTIHDFFGFPAELSSYEYDAPGAPDVAAEVADVAKPQWVGLDRDSWGLDHGTWSVLCHAFPDADVPVVQLSIDASKPLEHHLELAARLAPLRDRGVLIVGSGNIVHNLGLIAWRQPDAGFDWARRFDDAAREILLDTPGNLLSLQAHRDFATAVPTPDHFIPAIYLAALADAAGERPCVLVDGYANGSLSMTAYGLGIDRAPEPAATAGAPALPSPDTVPPEETNT